MKKKFIFGGIIIFLVVIVFSGIRFFSGEDDWICQNGEWVKHGNPKAEKPNNFCENVIINHEEEAEKNDVFESDNLIIGGPCSYDKFSGKCEVLENGNEETVRFKFKPEREMNLENYRWAKEDDILNKIYEESHTNSSSIKKGDVLNCTVEIITKGTCTPIIFSFD